MKPSSPAPDRLRAALALTAPAKTPKPKAATESTGQPVKASLCLYPADEKRIEAICAALAGQGHKITPSDAVRLALRVVEIDPKKLLRTLEKMKGDDGRTRRFT